MPHLHDLPEDIHLLILRELQNPSSWHHSSHPRTEPLSNLALASKPLLPLTQKVLYSEFWTFRGPHTWRIRAFLCTLIANPALAAHVRHLHLPCWRAWDRESDEWDHGAYDGSYDDERGYLPARNSRDKKLFQKAIRELAFPDKKGWRIAVRKDVDEVYVALLLLIVPNVKLLGISVPCNPVYLEKAFEHATVMQPAGSLVQSLQNLETVHLTCRGNLSKIDIRHVFSLFRMPSIKTLSINEVISSSNPQSEYSLPLLLPPNTTLKSFTLGLTDIETSVLVAVISSLKSLEELDYHHMEKLVAVGHTSTHVLHLDELGRALNGMGARLRVLKVDVGGFSSGTLGSLRECTRLESVKISL